MGKDSNSAHNFSVRCFDNLKDTVTHIDTAIVRASEKMVMDARLRLKVTIDSIKWLTFQACAYRGHDESAGSLNQVTLKQAICTVLADNNLSVQDIRGQGYDGLALVASSREVHEVHNFFQNAIQIINVVSASPKRNDQLLAKQAEDIEREIELGELDTGKVSNTKVLLGKLREDGWEPLLKEVQAFCMKHEIEVPDLSRRYVDVRKSRNKHDNTTTLHHYKADVFYVAIDQQLVELNDRFGVQNT
ncbi:uncharacterized protein [Lolium perenne]|uniref:uncharacterized protein n=1 Tax=Lolium perenne TaxID=4522 RepID=UPI003A998C5E